MTPRIWTRHVTSVAVAALLTLLLAAGCSADDGAPDLDDPAATASELVNGLVRSAQESDLAELDEWLSDDYLSQRTEGAPRDKAAILAGPIEINSFQVSDEVVAVQHGDVLTVSYGLILAGPTYETGEQPILATFVWDEGRWRALSLANYNDPSAALEITDLETTGRALVTEFLTISQGGDSLALEGFLADGFQMQRANGSGNSKDTYLENPALVEEFEVGDTVMAVQDGDSLTVRWSLSIVSNIDGEDYATQERPRLSSFVWRDGRWRLLTHANFNEPE